MLVGILHKFVHNKTSDHTTGEDASLVPKSCMTLFCHLTKVKLIWNVWRSQWISNKNQCLHHSSCTQSKQFGAFSLLLIVSAIIKESREPFSCRAGHYLSRSAA